MKVMRTVRAALLSILVALPAAAVLPAAVPVSASAPSCGGLPPVGSFAVNLVSTHGGSSVSLSQSTSVGGPSFSNGGAVYFSDPNGSPSSTASVSFGGTGAGTITVNAPSSAYSGSVQVCLNNDSQLYNAGVYTFNPVVRGPNNAAAKEGDPITVSGSFYKNQLSVTIGSCGAAYQWNSESTLTVTMPSVSANQCSGPIGIAETAADGTQLSASGGSVAVAPYIGGVSCSSPCYPGQTISVSGTGFGSQGSWNMGGAGGTWSGGDKGFSFRAPDGVATSAVGVTNYVGQGAQSAGSITILPHISAIKPANATEGSNVEVDGQDFGGSPGTITVGGQAVSLTGWGMDQATFSMPGAAGAVVLTTADGNQAVNSGSIGLVPVISGVSPSSAAPGSLVTISGSGFGQSATVTIGGKPAQVALPGDNEMAVIVPSGGPSGKLVVTNGFGQSATWGQTFTVLGGGSAAGGGSTAGGGNIYIKPNYGFLPLPKGPTPIGFRISAPSDHVKPGGTVPLTVSLQLNGKPVAGAPVSLLVAESPGSDTALSALSGVTDQNGTLRVTLKTSKKPGQTVVIARSGAFGDEIRIITLSPTAGLTLPGSTLIKTTTIDPHILYPFIAALILAVLLLLGAVVLQWRLHRRAAAVPVAASPAASAAETVTEAAVEAPKPARPRTRRPRKPAPDPEALELAPAVGAEDMSGESVTVEGIAPVIPLTRTRGRAKPNRNP